ncbi:hypothetical protein COO60DRAFT_1614785 [Scenedesmus sp. NREL 46B-D3]|nr:hypothetical protein COO60DRAFT_1614785 [Scenedesmus sp. NREL 46B-D3]
MLRLSSPCSDESGTVAAVGCSAILSPDVLRAHTTCWQGFIICAVVTLVCQLVAWQRLVSGLLCRGVVWSAVVAWCCHWSACCSTSRACTIDHLQICSGSMSCPCSNACISLSRLEQISKLEPSSSSLLFAVLPWKCRACRADALCWWSSMCAVHSMYVRQSMAPASNLCQDSGSWDPDATKWKHATVLPLVWCFCVVFDMAPAAQPSLLWSITRCLACCITPVVGVDGCILLSVVGCQWLVVPASWWSTCKHQSVCFFRRFRCAYDVEVHRFTHGSTASTLINVRKVA